MYLDWDTDNTYCAIKIQIEYTLAGVLVQLGLF